MSTLAAVFLFVSYAMWKTSLIDVTGVLACFEHWKLMNEVHGGAGSGGAGDAGGMAFSREQYARALNGDDMDQS